MSEITYDDKVDLQVATNIANINKVTASDMNEIKSVVNGNADEVGDISTLTTTDKSSVVNAINELNAPEKWVSVGIEEPTDGERVWFKKSKNLLQNNLVSQTISGVTFTKNIDETILVNGTATADISLYFSNYLTLAEGQYILTGCPSGGSSATYSMVLQGVARDTGSGKTFTSVTNKRVILEIKSGTTCNNLLFKPMIAEGSTASTFEPYIEPSINVDEEEWYNKTFAIKSKFYSSITTSSSGYANLNLKCNEVAVIGMKHDIIGSAAEVELYSNDQGYWYIRCSVGTVYGAHTITNLTVYYI